MHTSPTYCRYLRNPSLMDYYSFNRPRRDGWLSWPCWLADSGRFTHKVVTRPAVGLAQDRESSPASTGGLTAMLRHQRLYGPGNDLAILTLISVQKDTEWFCHFVMCCVADGSCVTAAECYCKLPPELGGVFAGNYPPGTVLSLDCRNW